ncbi:serine/threonine-protein phosphatase 6 regulatory ankyrin repeat subunit A-like [Sycon ciliatum]|uniref:serine/threonine-protein phosphatase 6 regulatory ankyrin repeat subunit A-like n=1 Tax=Sycon ciliatum TaxID=27933 RepID=UPI0031F6F2E6
MRHLLDSKANPNQPNTLRKTPLHCASERGHIDCMRHLLDSKANPNQPGENGHTPLDIAAMKGRLHVVKCLVTCILRKTTKQQCMSLFVQACDKSADKCVPAIQDGILDCIVGVHISQEDMDAWTELVGRLSEQCLLWLTQEAITIRKQLPPLLLVSSGPML